MIKPLRIQRSRQHKQVSPNGLEVVYVGRPSNWGNPFKVGAEIANIDWASTFTKKDFDKYFCFRDFSEPLTAEDCIYLFEKYHEISKPIMDYLKGKNLSCWCKIGEPCHADILLKLANE